MAMNKYNHSISKNKETSFYTFCGILIGFLAFIYPAAIFYLTLVIFTAYFIYNKANDHEKSFLLRIFFYALTLRLIVAAVMHILSVCYGFGARTPPFLDLHGGAIIGDDIGHHQRAWALDRLAKGLPLSKMHTKYLLGFADFGWTFHLYFLSFFYYLFGVVPFLGKCLNSLFGVLTGVIVYFISKESFNIKTAKLSAILTLFFPTLFLWSIVNLKDTILIFLLTLFLYCCISISTKRAFKLYLLLPVILFLINGYRERLIPALILALTILLITNIRWGFKKTLLSIIILAVCLTSFFICNPSKDYAKSLLEKVDIKYCMDMQKGHVSSGGTFYKIYPERFYENHDPEPINAKEISASLFRGMLSLIFRPLPWEINNKYKLFYYPVAIVWGLLSPFFIIGTLVTIRYYFRKNSILLSTFIIFFVLLSLTQGNTGTMIRFRDMITPVYLMFSSFGFVWLFLGRQLKAE